VKNLEKQNTDKFMFNGIKFFSDDAFVNLNMVVENPGYTDGHLGQFITPPDQLAKVMAPWWNAGFHIHVHSNGNGGNKSTINALSQLMEKNPRFDHRFSIEHYGISTPDMAKKIKLLGGVVSINPSYIYARSELNEPYLGTDRADTAAAFNSLINAGVPTSLHSDTPVAPPIPLKGVWMAVNRFGLSGKVHGSAERVTVEQAMRMITSDAAYTIGEENKIGSITPGKFADFTILEDDPYSIPKEKIKDIPIWGTVVGGRLYPANDYSD
jgi:predicted amidohydrolase YtcJ